MSDDNEATQASATTPKTRTVFLAADGFGEELKNEMKQHLEETQPHLIVEDLGTDTYFDAAAKVGTKVGDSNATTADEKPYGLLVCGTGMGVGMVANNFAGVRAATVENVTAVRCARAVNDANVLCLGQLVTPPEQAKKLVDAFFDQPFNTQPMDENGKPLEWWNGNVETFLSTSHEGLSRVEQEAKNA